MIDSKQNGSKTTIIVKFSPILVIEMYYCIKYFRILFFKATKFQSTKDSKNNLLQPKGASFG